MPVFQKTTSEISSHTNAEIKNGFLDQHNKDAVHKTHLFEGRYENIYLNEQHIPELKILLDEALRHAEKILSATAPAFSQHSPATDIKLEKLRAGYWFNHMPPGATTTLHTHDDDDELPF